MRYLLAFLLIFLTAGAVLAFPSGDDGIASMQKDLSGLPLGERIARWAEAFVGTPYDPDPMGAYVTRRDIVADDEVDCMYHAFRSVELAITNSPANAAKKALDMRFHTAGALDESGKVANYDERYQYAMDMIESGKWGQEVTGSIGPAKTIPGDRHHGPQQYIPAPTAHETLEKLQSGDMVFFVKSPSKRVVGEIIGHIGIIKREGEQVFLIHASGSKKRGGIVKKLLLADYLADTNFIGFKVSRF